MTRVRSTPGVVPPEALAHLRASDPVLRGVIDQVGSFQPWFEPDLWWSLVDSIASQQLSTRAAATIVQRLENLAPDGRRPTPEEVLALPDQALRACGLSGAKTVAVQDLATKWLSGEIRHQQIPSLPDEEVVADLTRVRGIGRWTVEMVLIFTLGRPDVLPVKDLGLQVAVQRAYSLPQRPAPAEVLRIGEPWRPFRSAATLYLWRSLKTG